MAVKQKLLLFLTLSIVLVLFITRGKRENSDQSGPPSSKLEPDPDCQCREVAGKNSTLLKSVCSQRATDRGPGQKVISYSFYGPLKSAYFNGIKENLAGMQLLYPGFIMRLYYDRSKAQDDPKFSDLCDLFCTQEDFDLCDVTAIDQYPELPEKFGMVWRFAPMADPLVSEWHCRDLDSRIRQREISAVQDWRASGKTYHIMRDNPYHVATIVGCCFGMRQNGDNFFIMKWDFEEMLAFVKFTWSKGLDQTALHAVVWPHAKLDMVAHDSYLCRAYKSEFNRPWPTQRISGPNFTEPDVLNFVGSNGGKISMKTHGPCDAQCRPKDHQDWLLC